MARRPRRHATRRFARRLEPLLERAARGEFASWAASPKRRLALILLFDQVPRNAYRGTAAAFAFDREALALTVEGMQLAADAALDPVERLFFYLPLEHAESLEAQDAAVAAFERLVRRGAARAARVLRVLRGLCAQASRRHREVRAISRIATRCWAARARRRSSRGWRAAASRLRASKMGTFRVSWQMVTHQSIGARSAGDPAPFARKTRNVPI